MSTIVLDPPWPRLPLEAELSFWASTASRRAGKFDRFKRLAVGRLVEQLGEKYKIDPRTGRSTARSRP